MPLGLFSVVELDDGTRAFLLWMIIGVHRVCGNPACLRIEPENHQVLTAREPHRPVGRGSDLGHNGVIGVGFARLGPALKLLRLRVEPSKSSLAESRYPQLAVAVELDRECPRWEIRFQRRGGALLWCGGPRGPAGH